MEWTMQFRYLLRLKWVEDSLHNKNKRTAIKASSIVPLSNIMQHLTSNISNYMAMTVLHLQVILV